MTLVHNRARFVCPARSAARPKPLRLSTEVEPRCAADAGPPRSRPWRSRISGATLARADANAQVPLLPWGARSRCTASGTRTFCAGIFRALAPLLVYCVFLGSASAQPPYVPDDWKFGKRLEANTLHYCVDARDPDFPVARKIGEAIAVALLLQPKEHVMGENLVGEDLDNLYRVFLETCDLYLGFKLIPDAYPEWIAVTRGYYRVSYVVAVAEAGWKSLAAMPRSQAIGATIGTTADLRLIQYLQSLPPRNRWDRFPMSSDEAALNAVLRGTTGAALVWAPALWALQASDVTFGKLRTIAPAPLPVSTADVGAAMLANETFLRSNVDRAIAALTADGTISTILSSSKFPATAVK
jgi:polar amino acid transport system substrate-binding protein